MTEERSHVSHSQLNSAFGEGGCLRAWAYRYVEKLSSPVSGRLHIGTAWDGMTRRVLEAKVDSIATGNEHFEAVADEAEFLPVHLIVEHIGGERQVHAGDAREQGQDRAVVVLAVV